MIFSNRSSMSNPKNRQINGNKPRKGNLILVYFTIFLNRFPVEILFEQWTKIKLNQKALQAVLKI